MATSMISRDDASRAVAATLAAFGDQPVPPFRLVGTAAALLQGVELPTADVDILCRERAEVDGFAVALDHFPVLHPATWLPRDSQYYCNHDVGGVEVGVSTVEVPYHGDANETLGEGPWINHTMVEAGGFQVSVSRLEVRLVTELHRGRPDRSEAIIVHLAATTCDLGLLEHALEEAAVSDRVRVDVLSRLRPPR